MTDSEKHQGLRNFLVRELAHKGIKDSKVLAAIAQVPRHLLLDSIFEAQAYKDIAFPIASGQTISRPYTVAFQTELLEVEKDQKILEIGTGSGYQSAVIIALGAYLYTIERQQELFKKTKILLPKMGYSPTKMVFGDGYKGLPKDAPFDGIIVTAGAPNVPQELLFQLKIGGKMVVPLGDEVQTMTVFQRVSEKKFTKKEYGNFAFVPMLQHVQTHIK